MSTASAVIEAARSVITSPASAEVYDRLATALRDHRAAQTRAATEDA